jgi:hypothetical protein
MDIHAIAPVGRPDDILHQRAPRSRPLRAFTEVFAGAIEMTSADNATHTKLASDETGAKSASGKLAKFPRTPFGTRQEIDQQVLSREPLTEANVSFTL